MTKTEPVVDLNAKNKPGRPPTPEWKKDKRRVLCSPASTFAITIRRWQRILADDGGTVNKPVDLPLKLTSQRFEATNIVDPGKGQTGYQVKLFIGKAKDDDGKVVNLMGCARLVTDETAREFGFDDTEDASAFEQFVELIEKRSLYGKKFAFVDDKEGMRRLMPRFKTWQGKRSLDEDDQSAILEFGAPEQVGPPLKLIDKEYAGTG